jgi:KipI family sensor histidine kinase inhibitor
MRARPAGDAALLVETPGAAAGLAADIAAQRWPGVIDVIPAARTVLVRTRPGSWDLRELGRRISALPRRTVAPADQPLAELPVCYDGPDLAEVARIAGLSVPEVVARHAGAEYTVEWLGFSPGFGYLAGLDRALCGVSRLERPRLRVPAGSVAIAGGLAAVYPMASPGGWRLLGRTSVPLWDTRRDPPALLAPGMRVRFRPVPHLPASPALISSAPDALASSAPANAATAPARPTAPTPATPANAATAPARPTAPTPATPSTPDQPSAPAPTTTTPDAPSAPAPDASPDIATNTPSTGSHDLPEGESPEGGEFSVNITEKPPRSWSGRGRIEVVRPGPLATIQDLGRPGSGHLGVRECGAADADSLRLANQLVGNPDSAAGLEITLGRAMFRCLDPCWLAVTGAPVTVSGDENPGQAASPGQAADPDQAASPGRAGGPGRAGFGAAFWVPADGLVRLGAPRAGLRTYVAVRGGIDVPAVLGSRSADLTSGLGPAPLRPGDLLPVGETGPDARGPARLAPGGPGARAVVTSEAQGPVRLTVIPGPRDDWFATDAIELLCRAVYTVSPDSDRAGLRLAGPALPRVSDDELPSEGLVLGALQVPPDGQPILLLADHPVTGGYPVIAVVDSADIGRAAQLRPGQQVWFAAGR